MKLNPRHVHFLKKIQENADDWLSPWQGDCWRFQDIEFPQADEILSGRNIAFFPKNERSVSRVSVWEESKLPPRK
ncbi:MAG: hypothetical protein JJU20_10220 [Opitutales bacterium]|nr:hypothetical protein [Opitutales bacterium]